MWKKIILTFLVLFSIPSFCRSALVDEQYENEICSRGIEEKLVKKLLTYQVRVFHNSERTCQRLEILKHGRVVFQEEGIGDYYDFGTDGEGKYAFGRLIGKGKQLIVRKWSGGAHCCNTLLIFDLGKTFKKIASVYGGNYDPELHDLDHDGIPEILLEDDVLAYNYSSFATSAHGSVVLKYKTEDTRFHPIR